VVKLEKYAEVARITLANQLVYIWDYLSRSLFFVLIMFVYFMLWRNMFASKGALIGGLTLNGMMWYLVVTELVTLSRPDVHLQMARDIKDGSIAYLLTKPYDYVHYNLAYFMGGAGVKLLTNSVIGLSLGFLFVGGLVGFSALHLPLVLFSIILGCILNFLICMSLALSAFWFEENQAFFWIYSKLVFTLGGMLMPLELFPSWLQRVASVLPFSYVAYAPARLAVDFSLSGFYEKVGGQLGYIVVFYALTMMLYRKGVGVLNVNGG
jgi:ABC-2 type transport system permease protein